MRLMHFSAVPHLWSGRNYERRTNRKEQKLPNVGVLGSQARQMVSPPLEQDLKVSAPYENLQNTCRLGSIQLGLLETLTARTT